MRTSFARLAALAVLATPLLASGVLASPASAAEGTTCSGISGSIKLSPGLEETARVQNITIKGTLSGCTGAVSSGKYVAQLKTEHAVSCSALSSAGEAAAGSIEIKWSPKGQGNSNGTFSMPLTSLEPVAIGGAIEKGPFATLHISGAVSQSYKGTCGGGKGKKKAKKVKTGTLTGSAVEIA